MNEFIKDFCKKTKLKVKRNPYSYGLGVIVLLLIIPLIIWVAYYIGDHGYVVIKTSLSVDGVFGFYGAFLSFLGTIALGSLALWQNRKYKAENDESQKRLEKLVNQANEISRQLMNLEKDKFRPYIKIDYPECIALIFGIQNIGQATISSFFIKKLIIYDNITGEIKGFMSSVDTSVLNEQKKEIALKIISQVPCQNDDEGNIIFDNQIYNYYSKQVYENIRKLQIEMTASYSDIYGREYEQEFSFHMQYTLEKETETELILKTERVSIQHHVGKSPYGPREDI